jgi:hypothetical protein
MTPISLDEGRKPDRLSPFPFGGAPSSADALAGIRQPLGLRPTESGPEERDARSALCPSQKLDRARPVASLMAAGPATPRVQERLESSLL